MLHAINNESDGAVVVAEEACKDLNERGKCDGNLFVLFGSKFHFSHHAIQNIFFFKWANPGLS